MELTLLLRQVIDKAKEAGQIILARDSTDIILKEGNANFVTPTDIAVSEYLTDSLPKLLDGSKMISEESHHNAAYQNGAVWVVDPIDGTNNFIYGFNFSVVSIGLLVDGKPTLGVIYNPYSQDVFTGIRGNGAALNGKAIHVHPYKSLSETMVLLETGSYNDRLSMKTFYPLRAVFRDCVDYRVTGCSALDICYVASGKVGAFFSELISIWDYAAALVILEEAGGTVSRWDGSPLDFGKPGTILVTNSVLHDEMLRRVAENQKWD